MVDPDSSLTPGMTAIGNDFADGLILQQAVRAMGDQVLAEWASMPSQ